MYVLTYRNAAGYLRVSPRPYDSGKIAINMARMFTRRYGFTISILDVEPLLAKAESQTGPNEAEAYAEQKEKELYDWAMGLKGKQLYAVAKQYNLLSANGRKTTAAEKRLGIIASYKRDW